MPAKCPLKSHPDWVYAVKKLGEEKTLFIYDKLGEEVPTKEQVDSLYTVPELPAKKEKRITSKEEMISAISRTTSPEEVEELLLGYKGVINSKRWEGKIWLKAMNETSLNHLQILDELISYVDSIYPDLISRHYKQAASFKAGRGIFEITVNKDSWNRYLSKDNDQYYKQGTLFKRNITNEIQDLARAEARSIRDFFNASADITDAYEYMDRLESNFSNLSDDHKRMMEILRGLKELYPGVKIQQYTEKDLVDLFDTDEEVEDYKDALGFYRNNKVFLSKTLLKKESPSMVIGTFLHEMIHNIVHEVFNKNHVARTDRELQFLKEMESLYRAANLRTKYKDANAYKNLEEFIADGITDQTIIDELKTMYDEKIGLTFWQKVKQFIARLLGLDTGEHSYHQQLLTSILDFAYTKQGGPSATDMIASRKLKDNIYINYDNPTHKAIVESLSELETAYDALTEKFEGVTSMMRRLRLGGVPYELLTEEEQKELDKYSGPGIETHFQIEKSFKSYIKEIEHKYNLTPEAIATLNKIFDKFKKPGVTILSEVKVADSDTKIVGKIDLVVIDENNKVHLFDFKTKIGGFSNFNVDYFPKKGQMSYIPFSSFKQASMQLTAYANMFKRITNTDVESMHVVPLVPTVDQETGKISGYELDKSFLGKDLIEISVSPWMPVLYSSRGITMDKTDNQDIISTSEQTQLLKERAAAWRNRIEKLTESTPEKEILDRVIKSLEHMIEITRKRSTTQKFKEQIKWINQILAEEDVLKALAHTVDVAFTITRKTYNDLKKLKESGDIITPAALYRFKDTVSAFNVLDEYESLLAIKYGLYEAKPISNDTKKKKAHEDFDLLRSRLNQAIQYKNAVKSDYERIGLEIMADFLYPYYTKVRAEYKERYGVEYRKLKRQLSHGDGILSDDKQKDVLFEILKTFNPDISENEYVESKLNAEKEDIDKLSKTMIRKELKKASRDISTLEAWIDNILDSPDSVTGALVKAFVIYDDTARIDIERERLAMLPIVREWEEYTKEFGKNYRKAYDFIIEKDLVTGEDTGHIVSKFHSSLIKEYRNLLAIVTAIDSESERSLFMDTWKEINMPLNKPAFQTDYLAHIQTLWSEDKITEEERTNLVYQATKHSGKRMTYSEMVEKGYISEGAQDLVIDWLQKNTWNYREPAPQWVNPQWIKLQNVLENENDPRTKIYNMITNAQNRADNMLPTGIKLGTRLPGIIKQKNERIASGQNIVDFVKSSLSKSLDFKVDDTHRAQTELQDLEGNARYFVPAHFTGRVTKTIKDAQGNEHEVFDPDEQSFDLANIYFNYLSSAIEFSWKNNILPEMELHKYLLKNRDVVQKDPFGNIKYRASRFFGGNKGELDEVTIKGGNISEQFNTWLLYALYGQAEKDLGRIPGTNIDAGKLLGNIQKFTALNLLGFNFVSGVANLGLGEILQAVEAFAGHHVGLESYHTGQMFYMKNFPGILGDIGSREPSNIVSLLLKEFNVLHNPKIDNLTDSAFESLLTTDTAFFTNHVGEHKMQTTFLLATLAKRRAYDKDGKDIGSILEHYKVVDGKLKLDDEVSEVKSNWENVGRRKFEHYVKGLLTRLHGAYGDLERVAIQQNAITAMAYMFRKFVVPGFRRRWGGRRYEERTEEFVEGNYRTTMSFLGRLIKSLRTQKALMLSREWALLSEYDKANIIRTVGEVVALITVIILANVAIKMTGDDDPEDDIAWNFFAYQALRLKSELLFFTSPTQTLKILRSPAASVSILENTIKLITQLTGPGWETYEQGPWKDHLKIQKTLIDMTIGVKQYYRVRDIGEIVDLWKI